MSKAHIHVREEVAKSRMGDLQDPISDLTDPNEMKKIIEKQVKELVKYKKGNEALQRNFESLSDFCKAEKKRSAELESQIDCLNQDNDSLRNRIKELTQQKITEPEPSSAPKEINKKSTKENSSSLKKTIQSQNEEIERLEDALRKVKIERELLRKDATVAKDKYGVKDKKIKELEKESNSLKTKITEINLKLQEKDKTIEELTIQMKSLKEKLDQSVQAFKIKETVINVLIYQI